MSPGGGGTCDCWFYFWKFAENVKNRKKIVKKISTVRHKSFPNECSHPRLNLYSYKYHIMWLWKFTVKKNIWENCFRGICQFCSLSWTCWVECINSNLIKFWWRIFTLNILIIILYFVSLYGQVSFNNFYTNFYNTFRIKKSSYLGKNTF